MSELYLGPRRDAVLGVDAQIDELNDRMNAHLDAKQFSAVIETNRAIAKLRLKRERLLACHVLDLDLIGEVYE